MVKSIGLLLDLFNKESMVELLTGETPKGLIPTSGREFGELVHLAAWESGDGCSRQCPSPGTRWLCLG